MYLFTLVTNQTVTLNTPPGMALTQNNDILISIRGSSEVKLLKSGEMQPFLSVARLRPLGIHVTNNNSCHYIPRVKWFVFCIDLRVSLIGPLFECYHF
jgi:hypothetical protein